MMSIITPGDRVVVADSSRYLAFPSAARHGSTIVAVWANKADHYDTTTIATGLARSTDGGLTWTGLSILTAAPAGPVQLTTHPQHGFALLEMAAGPYRGWVKTSADGVSWSAAKPVDWVTSKWKFPSGLTWIDDGTPQGLMLAAAYGGDGIMIAASSDAGVTWTRRSTPETEEWSGGYGYAEPRIVQDAAGALLLLIREDRTTGSRIVARRSHDLGVTWSDRWVAWIGTGQPDTALMPDGSLIATVRDTRPDDSPESWALVVSRDDGQTWTARELNAEWMMYGQLVPLAGGTVLLVGASQQRGVSTNSDIWAQRLAVEPRPSPVEAARLAAGVRRRPVERWLVGDFITGDVMADLQVEPGSRWSSSMRRSSITVKLAYDSAQTAALLSAIVPWRNYLAVVIDDQIVAAGPYVSDEWDADAGLWTLSGVGADRYWDRRESMPTRAATDWWQFYDRANKRSHPWSVQTWTGTWPEIGAAIARQALLWKEMPPYATNIPAISVPPVTPHGTSTSLVTEAIDHRSVGSILDDIAARSDGVEWDVVPRWDGGTPTSGRILWELRFGKPLLVGDRLAAWSHDRVEGLRTTRDGSQLTTLLHLTGGRADGSPLTISRGGAGSLLLLETLDSSHSDVALGSVLQAIGDEQMAYIGRPVLTVGFGVPVETVAQWDVGDFALLTGDPAATLEWQARIPHLAAETRLRIVGRSASAGDDIVRVETQHIATEDADAWISTASS